MEEREQGPPERRDFLALAALGIGGFLAAILTSNWYGMSWDEGYYYPCYEDAWNWIRLLFSQPGAALTMEGITAGWQRIDELPPVTRWLGAFFVGVTPSGWELETVRLFPALLFGATLSLIFATARRSVSFGWALAGALFYATHPRLFGPWWQWWRGWEAVACRDAKIGSGLRSCAGCPSRQR
jgi:hypothetical protein